jgi:hypothetical protein
VTKTKLRLVSDPVAIGAETWLLRYSRQLNESSSETFDIALSTKTGCIVDGVRQRKTETGNEESFVRGKFIDCANKVWRGEIYTPLLQDDAAVAEEMVAKQSGKGVSAVAKDEGDAFARREWFTFHADESDDAEPLAAGAGANAGTVCEGH